MVGVFGEEEAVGGGGWGEGGEEGEAVAEEGGGVGGDGLEEENEGLEPGAGDGVVAAGEAGGCDGVAVGVAEYVGGAHEQGLQLGVEFGVVDTYGAHAAAEDDERTQDRGRYRFIGGVEAQCFEQFRDECFDLVVGAFAAFGEFEYADIFGPDIVDYGGEVVGYGYVYIAGFASFLRDIRSGKSREIAVDDFDQVSVFKCDIVW